MLSRHYLYIISAFENAVNCTSCQAALLLSVQLSAELGDDAFVTSSTTICGTLQISSPLPLSCYISPTEFILVIYSSQTTKCVRKHSIRPTIVGTTARPSLVRCPVISPEALSTNYLRTCSTADVLEVPSMALRVFPDRNRECLLHDLYTCSNTNAPCPIHHIAPN